jgi:hypothetical protein
LEDRKLLIGAHIKYLEDEIEIRIESLKIELELLQERFKENLNKIKNEIIE